MAARIVSGGPLVLPDVPVMELIIDSCKKRGDKVYLEDVRSKKQSTFHQVLTNAGAVSSTLRKLGQGPGKVILILSDSSIEAVTTNIGTWLSGAASSAVNPSLPTEEIEFFIKTCKCEIVFCGEIYLDKVRGIVSSLDWNVQIICPNRQDGVLDYYKCLEEGNSEEGIVLDGWWTGKDHALSILFTSGTTGSPKGVVIRDEALLFNMHMKDYWDDNSIVMLTTPMYWISNSLITIVTGYVGSKVIIASRMSAKEVIETIIEYKPTEWFTGPSILLDMCKEENIDEYDFSSFKSLSVGGSILLPEHRRMISEKLTGNKHIIRNMYGSTETGMITYDIKIPDMDSPILNSVGRVGQGVEIKIADTDTGKLQPPYAIGEVCVRSAGLLKRYINKEVTENDLDKDGFWHLGDLGYYDEEDNIFYTSRLKDVMKYRGQQIAPAELERILQRHPDVEESCVVGKVNLEEGGDLPAAFIVKKPGSSVTDEDLHSYVSEHVIDEKKLRGGIYFVESIPKSPVGKILRNELKKLLA